MKFFFSIIICSLLFSWSKPENNTISGKRQALERTNLNRANSINTMRNNQVKNEQTREHLDSMRIEITKVQSNVSIRILDTSLNSIPSSLIDSLIISVTECSHCYNLNQVDTIRIIDLNGEQNDIYPIRYRDLNFDGIKDLGIATAYACCSGNNVIYNYWIYDKRTSLFVYNETLSNIPIWGINSELKEVTGGYSSSVYDYTTLKFNFKNDSIILFEELYSSVISDTLIRTILNSKFEGRWTSDTTYRPK
jgi:hypothetical protein